MPRIPEKDINYAEVGRWVLDYWGGNKSDKQIEDDIRARVQRSFDANPGAGDPPKVQVIFEQPGELVIVVPHNPWYDDTDCFDCAREMGCYQSELGIVIFGGCR